MSHTTRGAAAMMMVIMNGGKKVWWYTCEDLGYENWKFMCNIYSTHSHGFNNFPSS